MSRFPFFSGGLLAAWVPIASGCPAEPPDGDDATAAPTADELNSEPQDEYPELALDAQAALMAGIESEREAARNPDLRDQLPPADWIEFAYHGLVVDANFDAVELDAATVDEIQASIFAVVYPSAAGAAIAAYGADLAELYDGSIQYPEPDGLLMRTAATSALLAVADVGLQTAYGWRHEIVRGGIDRVVGWDIYAEPDWLTDYLSTFVLDPSFWRPRAAGEWYVGDCAAQDVPIPPDWPDAAWVSQGLLNLVFISTDLQAEVFTYKDPAVPGTCYALPRRTSGGAISLLGIICQSETTGAACFWDNRTRTNEGITGNDVTLDIDSIGNGYTLRENCTTCHRGDNVFNIHPGSALDLGRSGVVPPVADGLPWDTDPAVRYVPIGQSAWQNPGPLVLPAPGFGEASCTSCHGLPETAGSRSCGAVLEMAARTTMPPFPAAGPRAGWPGSATPVLPRYDTHVSYLATCP